MTMRTIVLIFAIGVVGCTKTNPNVCCTDAADCSSAGIPSVQMCSNGIACLSHQCIAETCSASSECTAEAPYCFSGTGLCAGTCSQDIECPGASQSAVDVHCVGGACVECRADVATDCSGTAPICDSGSCRGCKEHDECASGACGPDGTCVDQSLIEYVSKAGASGGDCSYVSPCNNLTLALSINRAYIVIDAGTYQGNATYYLIASRYFIGRGSPIITATAKGPIFTVQGNVDVHFAHLQISGATDTTAGAHDGDGILCPNSTSGTTIDLDDVSLYSNSGNGMQSRACPITVRRSRFRSNVSDGVFCQSNATVDRSEFSNNGYDGLDFDGAVLKASNVFAFHNAHDGIEYNSDSAGSAIEFCTTVDNTIYGIAAYQATFGAHTVGISNNLVARNGSAPVDCGSANPNGCIYGGNIAMMGSDISAFHFKSPDAQPYDYHLASGSSAIDAAVTATLDHDFDGDARPKGAGRDVGADEAQ